MASGRRMFQEKPEDMQNNGFTVNNRKSKDIATQAGVQRKGARETERNVGVHENHVCNKNRVIVGGGECIHTGVI